MDKSSFIGSWVRRFLLEYLVMDRDLSPNTQQSYRDTLRLILPLLARVTRKSLDKLEIEDMSAAHVKTFLQQVEEDRGCGAATRNQRLAAIRSLASFIATHSPEHISWYGQIRAIPFKRSPRPELTYLEKSEIDALLQTPDHRTAQGRRDHAILVFLYNSGARASEVATVQIGDLDLHHKERGSVLIHGKGGKIRRCPLWARTIDALKPLIEKRPEAEHVFLNRRGKPLTRYGIYGLVERHVKKAAKSNPAMAKKQVSPHTIRHTTATHLLRAGVDINTIRAWLGHVCLSTTNIYAEVDLEMKARALAACEIQGETKAPSWHDDGDLMDFLNNL
jgi:site-specific recombinase XerD